MTPRHLGQNKAGRGRGLERDIIVRFETVIRNFYSFHVLPLGQVCAPLLVIHKASREKQTGRTSENYTLVLGCIS